MEKKRKGIFSALFGAGGLYIASALALVAVCAAGYALLSPEEDPIPSAQDLTLPVSDTVVSEDIPQDIAEDPPIEEAQTVPTLEPEIVELPQTYVEPEVPTLAVNPLQGDVVAAFSMDALVFNPTTADWRAHNGIDIASPMGAEVHAAMSGTVLSVTEDALMGVTVTVEGTDGYVTTYSNLAPEPPVAENDTVSAGDVIGLVGATSKIEADAPPHLHFSVFKDANAVDPTEYLKN